MPYRIKRVKFLHNMIFGTNLVALGFQVDRVRLEVPVDQVGPLDLEDRLTQAVQVGL